MKWRPTTEEEIWDDINEAFDRMDPPQRRMWEAIKIVPEKWQQSPWGEEGGGFWAVAIIGQWVVWYNDIEDGFNLSSYSKYGTINEYWCNQDELEWVIQTIIDRVKTGNYVEGNMGPPESIA